jgi:hypothetical protein
METNLETTIINNLIHNEVFCRKALPHIKPEYFDGIHRTIYEAILKFITKYNKLPNSTALSIEYKASDASRNANAAEVNYYINALSEHLTVDEQWIIDSTEKWCKDRAVYLAIMESISIIDGKDLEKSEGSIPTILSKALSVTFDTNVGHDYLENAESRYEFYHKTEDKIPFDLDMFNVITGGGIPRKTLNIILAGCVHPETPIRVRIHKKILS